MYKIAKMKLEPEVINEESLDSVIELLGMLYKNGQILYEYLVEKHESYYIATITTSDDDSLNPKYFNKYIEKELENIKYSYEIVANDALSVDSCKCKEHSYYVFAPFYDDESSPVLCGDCGKEIPLIHIPYIYNEEEHFHILTFQRTFRKVDGLWMDSLSDRFTKRQLTYHDSELSKRGIEISKELESVLNKPVYYLLPSKDIYNINRKKYQVTNCVKCKSELKNVQPSESIDKLCVQCRLAYISD